MAITGEIKGDVLTLHIDVSAKARAAASFSKSAIAKQEETGKAPQSKLLATSSGFITFGDVKVSLNAMIPA